MKKNRPRPAAGFTLVELLVVVAILVILVSLASVASTQALAAAKRTESVHKLASLGQAILLYAGDNDQTLPGPLWPGQVLQYDATRDGRFVRELADYLQVEKRASPYVVTALVPRAYQSAMAHANLADVRVYVTNSSIVRDGETLRPFGSLTTGTPIAPLRLPQLTGLPDDDKWMVSEADQWQPDVVSASWAANTPARPVHGTQRAVLYFDGRVELEKVAAP